MKILLVEDNPGDARLIREMLKEAAGDFTIDAAEKLGKALESLASQDVDVVLLDLGLPDSRGLETLMKLQAQFSHLPVVIMTGSSDEALGVQAVQLGAQDYLVKGQVDSRLLRRALVYAIERKQSEDAVLRVKEEWELTFNTVPDLIAILDKQHQIIRVNKAMADRLGTSPGKCVGLHCYEAVHGLSCPPDFCPHSLTCQDGKEHIAEVNEPRLGGVFLVSTTPMCDKHGLTIGSIHVVRDITELKQMEQRLAVQERLAYLGKMAGTIAHEVRNPLAAVDASAYYLEKTLKGAGGKTEEHLRRMRTGVTRAANIIEKLLEMSRMREPVLRPLDLSKFMADAILAAKVPPEIRVISDGREEINVMADEEQLLMAVGNILKNGVEAMPGGGTLTVNVRKAGNQAEVSVKDTGPGIPPETFGRLFEPLFTTKQGGVGFGLALAKTVVEKHHGRIVAKSEPGKGATFVIYLPLHFD